MAAERKDVARNRERLLRAADALVGEHGTRFSLDDVARGAGLGVGTVYRHFPDREQLFDALFAERIEQVVALARLTAAMPEPAEGLRAFLDGFGRMQQADAGLREVLRSEGDTARIGPLRAQITPIVDGIVERGRAGGTLPAHLHGSDVVVLVWLIGSVIDYSAPARPEVWRRYLDFLLAGMQIDPPGPPRVPALSPDELDLIMTRRQSAFT